MPAWAIHGYLLALRKEIDRPEEDLLTPKARRMAQELSAEAAGVAASPLEQLAMDELWDPPTCAGAESDDGVNVRRRYETRSPFLDFEFIADVRAIPRALHGYRGIWRAVQKTAFQSLLSREVVSRIGKAEFTAVRQRRLEVEPSSAASGLVELGLVRRSVIERLARQGSPGELDTLANRNYWRLLAVQGIDRWLESEPGL